MRTGVSISAKLCRTLALTALAGTSAWMAKAQTVSPVTLNTAAPTYSTSAEPELTADAPDNELAANATRFNFIGANNAMQYGGRRAGRPRYRGGNTNPDGSAKYVFYAGGGFTVPTGVLHHTNTTSWGAQVGAGRNLNKNVGINVEFNWDNFGLNGNTLNNQQNLYNNYITVYNQQCALSPTCAAGNGFASSISGLDGYSHVWSFGLEPVYNIAVNEGLGAYLEGGVGFYHKITTFTVPAVGEYCDYYYGCYTYQANSPIDSYTSNAPGINGGIGLTYKFSRFSNEQLYAEARYVYMFNSYRSGVDASTCTSLACAAATYNYTNDYRANSQRTSYIPVKFGIRF